MQINERNNDEKSHLLLLPSSGPKSERLIRSMKKTLISKRPVNNATKSAYSAVRLSENFNIKNKTVKEHQHDIVLYVQCPEENWNKNYVGETGRKLLTRFIYHKGRGKKSHI